jgi:hypothetical protein
VPNTVSAFDICVPVLLLVAAVCQSGCKAVSDDLFLLDPTSIAQAGTSASAPPTDNDPPDELPMTPDAGASMPAQPSTSGSRPSTNSSVVFGWTESIPGAGACQAANFTGSFECMVATIVGRPDRLSGKLQLLLQGSSEEQTLDVGSGQITAYDDNGASVVIAAVNGALECRNQSLTAMLEPTPSAAMPIDRQIAWVNFAVQPITTGMLTGSLDPDLQEITGSLQLMFEPGALCIGKFAVKAWATR